jgi:uncharacterized protein (TIGR00299 family) protein
VRIAFLDPFSGASGDMLLGALVDAGLSLAELSAGLEPLGLEGYRLMAQPVNQHGISGTRVQVEVTEEQPARDWAGIRTILEQAALPDPARTSALRIFERLATAEATVHGMPVEDVHFHEVGAVDAIVDICGAALGLHLLGIEAVYADPPRLGAGFVRAQHGLMPIPAPATAELLAMAHTPSGGPLPDPGVTDVELLTPTGAAILTTLATFTRPVFAPAAVGYGFGQRELPWPYALRVWVGEMAPAPHAHTHDHHH